VLIVGGGPAGLAAAIAAREKGFRVLVADCSHPPIEKPCGEGLMPDSLAVLRRLGVSVGPSESFPFRGIRFLQAGSSVEAPFPSRHGLGVRRAVLHRLLVGRARESGAHLVWDARVTHLGMNSVTLDDQTVRCRWIVAADGQNSLIRRWAGLDRRRHWKCRFAFRRHYRIAPWTDYMEIHWGNGCQIYITPVSPEEVCVVLMSHDRCLRLDHALPMFPELHIPLRGVPASAESGALSVSAGYESVTDGRVVLMGDASGSVDAITGQGLHLSFQQALALAAAIESGDLTAYQSAHRSLMQRPMLMSRLLLTLDRFPAVRGRALQALAAKPEIFSHLLAAHLGTETLASVVAGQALPLLCRLLPVPGMRSKGERCCGVQ